MPSPRKSRQGSISLKRFLPGRSRTNSSALAPHDDLTTCEKARRPVGRPHFDAVTPFFRRNLDRQRHSHLPSGAYRKGQQYAFEISLTHFRSSGEPANFDPDRTDRRRPTVGSVAWIPEHQGQSRRDRSQPKWSRLPRARHPGFIRPYRCFTMQVETQVAAIGVNEREHLVHRRIVRPCTHKASQVGEPPVRPVTDRGAKTQRGQGLYGRRIGTLRGQLVELVGGRTREGVVAKS